MKGCCYFMAYEFHNNSHNINVYSIIPYITNNQGLGHCLFGAKVGEKKPNQKTKGVWIGEYGCGKGP